MPRNISVRRKYWPALSMELSLPSSHRLVRGSRKPEGGGPAGVAARRAEVENAAVAIQLDGEDRAQRKLLMGTEVGRVLANTVRDLVAAIVVVLAMMWKYKKKGCCYEGRLRWRRTFE